MSLIRNQRPDLATKIASLPIEYATLPARVNAQYYYKPYRPRIAISKLLDEVVDVAVALVHEGTHALEDVNGELSWDVPFQEWVAPELSAYRAEATFWSNLFPNGKYPELDPYDKSSNASAKWLADGTLDGRVSMLYLPEYLKGFLVNKLREHA